MSLSVLLHLLEDMPGYKRVVERVMAGGNNGLWVAVPEGAKAYLIAALHQRLGSPVLFVALREDDARVVHEELRLWCACPDQVYFFPEVEHADEDGYSIDCQRAAERLRVLHSLGSWRTAESFLPLVVSSCRAAVGKTVAPQDFASSCCVLEKGKTVDLQNLLERWLSVGYRVESLVEVPGSVARRGGIIDIFPPNSEFPVRIELFGNKIESIRYFDPRTQRSVEQVASVTIVPASENVARLGSLFDYFAETGLLVVDSSCVMQPGHTWEDSQTHRETGSDRGGRSESSGDTLWNELSAAICRAKYRLIVTAGGASGGDNSVADFLPLALVAGYGGKLQYLADDLKKLRAHSAVVLVSQQVERLAEFLQDEGIEASVVSNLVKAPPPGSVTLIRGSLHSGWRLADRLTLLTDREIFGFAKQQRYFGKRPVRYHWLVSELVPGDYVVHVEHGIGRFLGLARMLVDEVEREYLILEYAAGDKLYVPVEQAERVSRYIGAGDAEPVLTRLGTQEWSRTRRRIKESMLNMARELLELYARRQLTPGFAFSRDTIWQQELEASFPYVETPDQAAAVRAVKSDMEKPKPMDRLVCGDVGYGKTEVALRAAFKAVMDGKQVAVLVPTTVLAQQHFNTFRERLQAFPINVAMLSRFCDDREQARVLAGLAAGTVDICIGTHRLLQKDVVFKDLGLVIIDEEQRFGVVHKEHFKKLRQEVDVLTLSATPIPRTLHMSLTGIKDMSIIETPPEERLPVSTYVGVYDERLVRKAILREMQRGGQVFYVHNRIHDIYSVASNLKNLVPESRILVAHGRMPEDELETVMTRFLNREADVLVVTTIIESGLDMPNVNTLIVDQADLLGLTQLYQLRGRVGRGCNHAYAYFFYEAGKQLTPEAWKRLKTIAEATELGAGFAVAMRDLEIRGAGNLLGVEQSGYVAAVGFDLYCRMLAEAVEELKRGGAAGDAAGIVEPKTPRIDLPLSAYIPEDYVPDLGTRLNLYRRLAEARSEGEAEDIAAELTDRFGNMPQPVRNLLYMVKIKQLATDARISSILKMGRYIVVQCGTGRNCGSAIVGRGLSSFGLKVSDSYIKIDTKVLRDNWDKVLEEVLRCFGGGKDVSN